MNPPLPDPVRASIEHERDVPPIPDGARERIRARIDATITPPPPPTIGLAAKLAWPLAGLATAAVLTFALWPTGTKPPTNIAPSIATHTPAPTATATTESAVAPLPPQVPKPSPNPMPAPAAPTPAAPTPAETSTPVTPTRDPARERALLDRAQAALSAGEIDAAMAATQEHQRRWPRGSLTEEREVLTLRAYVAAGQTQAATRAAEAFRRRYPRSIYRAVVDALLPPPDPAKPE